MRLTFVQLRTYVADLSRLGLTDDDQRAIEAALLDRPTIGVVMPGTGGLRKMRYAPLRSGGGKSGGIRICYAFFEIDDHIYLVTAFAKNEQANLSATQKNAMRLLLHKIQQDLNTRRHHD